MVAFPVPVGGLRKAPTELLGRKEVSGGGGGGCSRNYHPLSGVGGLSVFSRAPESSTTLRDSCTGARGRLDRNTEGTDFRGHLALSRDELSTVDSAVVLWALSPA